MWLAREKRLAIDRTRLEQEALRLLQKGQLERALERYLTLLKDKPRDLRVRQQVADLYSKVGQKGKAEQHLREIAKFHKNSGKARAAIGVYKQILRLKPDDLTLYGDLGTCYEKAGFPKEARESYEKVVESLSKYNPDKAVPYQKKLIALQPGNLPVQVRLAELFEASNWAEKAQAEWRRLAKEARRHGKLDDRARFLMKSIAARDSVEISLEAAEAWVDLGDWDTALPLLQKVTSAQAENPQGLRLLAKTLTGLGAKEKARQVWLLVADLYQKTGDAVARSEALKAAVEAGASDPNLAAAIAAADLAAERMALRITDCDWASPGDDAVGDMVVRAGVYCTYGFPEKALELLQSKPAAASQVPVQAALVEALVLTGAPAEAVAILKQMSASTPAIAEDLRGRELVIEGRLGEFDAEASQDADDLIDDDDELLDDELLDDELLDDDDEAGEDSSADALDDELLDDELLDDEAEEDVEDEDTAPPADTPPATGSDALGSLLGGGFERDGMMGGGAEDDGLASLFGDSLSEASPASSTARVAPVATPAFADGPLADAQALLQVGALDQAAAIVGGGFSLAHGLLQSQVRRARGDFAGALTVLRGRVDEASEDDPSYLSALIEMAELSIATGKSRAARRLLDEVEDLDPNHEAARVARVRHAMGLLAR